MTRKERNRGGVSRGRRLGAALFAAGLAFIPPAARHGFRLDAAQASPNPAPGQDASSSGVQALGQSLLAEQISQQFFTINASKPYLATSNLTPLVKMIAEIGAGHQAHVSMLQQLLGSSAPAAPAFQNLDAGSLAQFLSLAEKIEDLDVSLHQGVLASALQNGAVTPVGSTTGGTTAGTASNSPVQAADAVEVAILVDDARFDGGVRAFDKTAGTANGGNPDTTLTQSGTPLAPGFSFDQAQGALQSFIAGDNSSTNTNPSSGTTTPGTGGTMTGGTATGATATPPAPAVSFSKDILRILTNNGAKTCARAGCHGGPNPQLGQNLSAATAYANIVNVPSVEKPSLMRVKPGDSANSYLYQKITGAPGISGSRMPLAGGPLAASDIALIRQWIDAGALNN